MRRPSFTQCIRSHEDLRGHDRNRRRERLYRSVQEVPEPLRTQLREITNGANAGTIVIADRAGKEKITSVLARRESSREHSAEGRQPHPGQEREFLGISWMLWMGALLLLVAACIIAAAFSIHW